ncbi:NAD(P)/FAD-dependent oxidoreductase [Paenibacillus sp. NPDC056579]|uniref:NAD(P)/FAD-dependent oxidoreductase n=1 Tax=unclassified Paenibacillus TaxID=185978 RepID=UPI001EF8E567|nr:FAD-dependent oxidoreductase [Paenibacillus sp. H1-7]ULL20011.1 NAD(P)/FAD-dependent oxidoreductase [Paenibacillus sp. H1-7]
MKKMVILGGGYGGLTVATELLEKELPSDTVLVLVDRMPYQGLKTEYYALAAGTVSDQDIRVQFPVDPRLILKYGEVTGVDLENKLILFQNDEPLSYDWLALGLGCVDKFHQIEGADQYAESIQTLSSTRKTYQKVNDIAPYGQVTIVGGGLSGVEVAAELRESRSDLNIRILDRGASVMSAFPGKLQSFVRDWMLEHDIEMRSHVCLTRLENGILHNQQELIYTDVTIWTAGIQPSPIVQQLQLPKDNQGRLIINEYHQIEEYPEVFVIGDCASLPFSPSAQAAQGQGKQVAEVLRAIWKNETPRLGKIKLKGVLGSLGKKSGFALLGKRPVTGMVPRAIKSGVLWMSKRHFG